MDLHELFIKPYENYTFFQIFLEATATFFGLLSVFFSVKRHILVYPTGIISTTIYVYILFNFGLLGDMLINVYYSMMSIYGWILWQKNADEHYINPLNITSKEWAISGILFVLSMILVGMVYYFKPYIDNQFSMEGVMLGLHHLDWAQWLDIFTTSIFLVGMWLMAKRKIENWIFWIIGDLICIPMMIYKGLGITALQYLVFTVMAIIGYLNWKSEIRKN